MQNQYNMDQFGEKTKTVFNIIIIITLISGLLYTDRPILHAVIFLPVGIVLLLLSNKITEHKTLLWIIGAACIISALYYMAGPIKEWRKNTENQKYTKSFGMNIDKILAISGSFGTKFIVYDENSGMMIKNCLSKEHEAVSVDEIAGVFIVRETPYYFGSYNNGDGAYRTDLDIVLQSTYNQEVLGKYRLLGKEPGSISYRLLRFWHKDHYGERPGDKEICFKCENALNSDEIISKMAQMNSGEDFEAIRNSGPKK